MLPSSNVGKHVVAVCHSTLLDFGYNVPPFSGEKSTILSSWEHLRAEGWFGNWCFSWQSLRKPSETSFLGLVAVFLFLFDTIEMAK